MKQTSKKTAAKVNGKAATSKTAQAITRHELLTRDVIEALQALQENKDKDTMNLVIDNAIIHGLHAGLCVHENGAKEYLLNSNWNEHGKRSLLRFQKCIELSYELADKIKFLPRNTVTFAHGIENSFCEAWDEFITYYRGKDGFISDIFAVTMFYLPIKKKHGISSYTCIKCSKLFEIIKDLDNGFELAQDEKKKKFALSIIAHLRGLKIKGAVIRTPDYKNEGEYNIGVKDGAPVVYNIDFWLSNKNRLAYEYNAGTAEKPDMKKTYIPVADITSIKAVKKAE